MNRQDHNGPGRYPLFVRLDQLHEAKVAVHKVTPKRVSLYVKDAKKPAGVKVVPVKHSSVKAYADKATDPPAGSKYNPVGYIDTDTYTGPDDVQPYGASQPEKEKPASPYQTGGGPNPDNFIPVYNWDQKHLWVFVKKPGQTEPIGPVAVAHKDIKKYKNKLGYLSQKVKLIGKIDPNVYSGPEDIYPLDWDPGDPPPQKVPTAADAMAVKFQPGGLQPADVTTTSVLQPKEPKPDEAPGVPPEPGEFANFGMKDANGFPLLKHKGSGMPFTLLPGGKISKWEPDEGKYYVYSKGDDGWHMDLDHPPVDLEDLKKGEEKPPEGFELPPGHKIKSVKKSYVVVTTPDGEDVKWIKMTDSWHYMDDPWKEYNPPKTTTAPKPPETAEEIPANAPTPPLGFKIAGPPNKHGTWPLKTDEYHDDGNFFASDSGKLLHYDVLSGSYEQWEYGEAGWQFKSDKPLIPPAAVAALKHYPQGGPPIPEGYDFVGYDKNGLPSVRKSPSAPMYAVLPNGVLARWSESKGKYKTQYGELLTLEDIFEGNYGSSDVASQEQQVSEEPEEPPVGVTYAGGTDANGLPLVDEYFEDEDEDEDYGEKGLTLLPDDRVARWKPMLKAYRIYDYDPNDGYIPSKKSYPVPFEQAERLMHSLGLTVQNGKYHKITQKESGKDAPSGYELVTPTEAEHGLIPILKLDTNARHYWLPGNLVGIPTGPASFDVYALTDTGAKPTHQKNLSLNQLKMLSAGLDPNPPDHTVFTGKNDPNGYPLVKTVEEDILTALPNGEVAAWKKKDKKYHVWDWDKYDDDFLPSHPAKFYTLKQVHKMKPKDLPSAPAAKPQAKKAPEPAAKPPDVTPQHQKPGYLAPTGEKDVNGYPLAVFTDELGDKSDPFSKLPILSDYQGGVWSDTKKAYKIWAYEPSLDTYKPLKKAGKGAWWIPGETDLYYGDLGPGGIKAPSTSKEKSAALDDTGKKDHLGYPIQVHPPTGKEMSLTPKGPGVWSSAGYYMLQYFDPDSGTYYHAIQTGSTWTPPDEELVKAGIKKAKASKAAAKPTDMSKAPETVKDMADSIPDPKQLKLVGDGGQLGLGGAGKKSVFQDPTTNKKYIFKPAIPKGGGGTEAFRAHSQEAFAALAKKVRPDHIPIKTVKIKGQLGTLQPMVDLAPEDTLRAANKKPKELTDQQKADVATEHMLDWLMSQHDSHDGNLALTADGRVVSVDKEQGFKYFGSDELDTEYHPNGKYGEKEPYYNTFWRSFSKGEFDFNPMESMKPAFEKIDNVSSADYVQMLRPYAEASFPGDPVKQDKFLQKALNRKLRLRKDMEDFITEQYKKRTGKDGTFNFEDGWMTTEEKKKQKTKTINFSGPQLAKDEYGIKEYQYQDPKTQEPQPHLDRVTLKISKETSQTKLFSFLEELGLEALPVFEDQPDPRVMTGSAYHMVVVPKSEYQSASVTKEVLITEAFLGTPEKPKYWPEIPDMPQIEPNVEDIDNLPDLKAGREGHHIMTDGPAVEGQAGKAKKFRDAKGDYFFVHYKLRPAVWKKIAGSTKVKKGSYTFHEANYDPKEGVFVESKAAITSIHEGVSWEYKGTECFLATGKSQYAYMGAVYMKVRNVSKGEIQATVTAALNHVKSGLGDTVFKAPTKEEREIMKLSRLLWAKAPQAADKLPPEEDRTVKGLQDALKKAGVSSDDADKVEEQEVFKSYHSHVEPGRWKKIAKDTPLFVFNGIGSLESAVSILQSGLMSIHERNLAGIPKFGGSYDADVQRGSGDGILCRVVPKSGFSHAMGSHPFGGKYQAIMHPDVLDRLDCYMHPSDSFGECREGHPEWTGRKSVESRVSSLKKHYSISNEISFRKGVHKAKIVRIATNSETSRKSLITEARNRGITEVNGVPIEDFVVVATKGEEVYNKYVKPMVGV